MMSVTMEKQTRIQSPSYPNLSLRDAVTAVAKIYGKYRSSAVDRVDAAKLLGYTGVSGPSNMALASLSAFGLVERAGKGELRVTGRARSILHPASEDEKRSALRDAALSPQLYRDLRERFPDVEVPPEEGVTTYLNRLEFNRTAVRPATNAFLQTMAYLQETGVRESRGALTLPDQDTAPALIREEPAPMHITPLPQLTHIMPPHGVMASAIGAELSLNEPILNIRGGTVRIEALLDYDGLAELETQIKALRMILKPRNAATSSALTLTPEPGPADDL